MKTISTLVSCVMLAICSVNAEQIATIVADGTNTVHFVCEDENISAENLAVISNDFARILAPWTNHCHIIPYTGTDTNRIGSLAIESPRGYERGGLVSYRCWGGIVKKDGVNVAVVSKSITDRYSASTVLATHSSEVQTAIEFAAMLSTNNFQSLGSSNINDIYLTKEYPPRGIPESVIQKLLGPGGNLRDLQVFPPSLLSFALVPSGPEEQTQYLWCMLPAKIAMQRGAFMPMVYYDGQWWLSSWLFEDGEKAW